MTSSRVIQLISFSWGAAAAFILLQSFLWVKSRGPLVADAFRWLVIIIFHAFPCVLIFFCFASMLRVIYKQRREAHVLGRQRPFNNRREKSALIMMSIVVALFLVYCAIYIGCVLKVITDECHGYIQRIALFTVILNSAVNPLAYAFFKRDIKKEIKKLTCRTSVRRAQRIEDANKRIVRVQLLGYVKVTKVISRPTKRLKLMESWFPERSANFYSVLLTENLSVAITTFSSALFA